MFKYSRIYIAIIIFATPLTGRSQWYVNPQQGTGSDPGNVAVNGMVNGAYGLISGNGITPGGGVLPAAAATVAGNEASSGGSVSPTGGYSFTSDPISAYVSAADNGMANLIRAQGDYNEKSAKALTQGEIARAAYVENQVRVFNARRQLWRASLQARADEAEERGAQRLRSEAFLASHRPPPLNNRQLDPSTAAVRWPAALKRADFDDDRREMEDLIRTHASPGSNDDVSTQLRKKIHETQNKLHEHILNLDLQDYSEARQFLDRMAVTAQSQPQRF